MDEKRKFYDVMIPTGTGAVDSIIMNAQGLVPGVHLCLHDNFSAPFIRFWATDREWNKLVFYLNICQSSRGPEAVYYCQ